MSQQDDRAWAAVGAVVAAVLLVVFVGFWTGSYVFVGALALGFAAVVAGVLWLWDRPERGPKMADLPPEEQERRRQAGRILREVVPPVSEEEARRLLAPPWMRGPDDWPGRPAGP